MDASSSSPGLVSTFAVLFVSMLLLIMISVVVVTQDPQLKERFFPHVRLLESATVAATPQEQDVQRKFLSEPDRNVPALFLCWTVGSLANAAGVGGGAFFVPLFNTLLHFSLKGSTALSQAVITGGAIASTGFYFTKRNPTRKDQPLIDFKLALMLTPMLLFGVSVGVLLNVLFPNWLVTILLTTLLLYLSYSTARKSLKVHAAERRAAAAAARLARGELSPTPSQASHSSQAPPAAPPAHAHDAPPEGLQPNGLPRQGGGGTDDDAAAEGRRGSMYAGEDGSDAGKPWRTPLGSPARGGITTVVQRRPSESGTRLPSGTELAVLAHPGPGQTLATSPSPRERPAVPPSGGGGYSPGGDAASVRRRGPERTAGDSAFAGGDLKPGGKGAAGDEGPAPQDDDPKGGRSEAGLASHGIENDITFDVVHPDVESPLGSQSLDRTSAREEEAAARWPWLEMGELFVLWAAYMALQGVKAEHDRCSIPYYALYCVQAVLSIGGSIAFLLQAHRSHLKEAAQPQRQQLLRSIYEEDMDWSLGRLVRADIITLVGGVIAGLLGIGGGMIIGPLLLALGVHPLVTAATSSLMVLFSSSAAALTFGFEHLLNTQFALVYGVSCLFSSLIGVTIVNRIVKRSGKASIVVMILAGVIALGAVLTAVFGGISVASNFENNQNLGFSSFCGS